MGVIPANAERNWETIQDRFHPEVIRHLWLLIDTFLTLKVDSQIV